MKVTLTKIHYTILILVITLLGIGCGEDRSERLPTEDMLRATPSVYDFANPNMPEVIFIEYAPFDYTGTPITNGTGVFQLNKNASSYLALGNETGSMVSFDLEDEGVAEAWLVPSRADVGESVIVYAYGPAYPYDIVAHTQVRIIDSGVLTADFNYTPDAAVALLVHFQDRSADGGDTLTYSWDFDNDSVVDSVVQNPNYTFPAEGWYTVTLTITNSVAATDSTSLDIYVE